MLRIHAGFETVAMERFAGDKRTRPENHSFLAYLIKVHIVIDGGLRTDIVGKDQKTKPTLRLTFAQLHAQSRILPPNRFPIRQTKSIKIPFEKLTHHKLFLIRHSSRVDDVAKGKKKCMLGLFSIQVILHLVHEKRWSLHGTETVWGGVYLFY